MAGWIPRNGVKHTWVVYLAMVLMFLTPYADCSTEVVTEIVTEEPTQDPGVTTEGVTDSVGTTDATSQTLDCYVCNGTSCSNSSSLDTMCTSSNGACWMTYSLTDGAVTRGCTPEETTDVCSYVYPGGTYGGSLCSFCCTSDSCNNLDLTSATCTDLQNRGATQPEVSYSSIYLTTLLFSFSSMYTAQRL